MPTVNRRLFLKRSAALAAAGRVLLGSASGAEGLGSRAPQQPVPAEPATPGRGFDHPFFAHAERPDVIAHRGGDGERPGETLMAMQGAFDLKADVLEMDVYLTKDKHLVLMHDILVSKTTEVGGPLRRFFPVHEFELSELQSLNAGYRWPKGGEKAERFTGKKFGQLSEQLRRGLRVPTLREVFETFPRMRMNVEMKPAFVSPAAALDRLIREKGMGENVLVASFWHPYLREYRSLNRDVATSASAKELIAYLTEGKRPKADAIQIKPQFTAELKKRKIIRWSILTEEFLRRAHGDNLPVHAWTINDEREMLRVKALGVDGIITDYPKRLLNLLQRPAAG